ncbi:MAG: tetratricopeptide repeat protein [bacterium]
MYSKNSTSKTFLTIRYEIVVSLFLVITILTMYWQVRNHEFVSYDDTVYVTENPYVVNGLTIEGIIWSFKAKEAGNWHPITWLSHMLDAQLYGKDAGRHHMTSVLFHIMNSLLLFFIFYTMTKDIWQSAFIAVLFALHPLNVESVAWVAERKNVVSTFFWMLTLASYIWYSERPGSIRYLIPLILFALGLMAKPMVVTLPFVLILMDYWPLKRFEFFHSVYEKIPFFVLTVISCIVTFHAQLAGGAVGSLNVYPWNVRIANALVSYIKYLGKMIWPFRLTILYPYPETVPLWHVVGASLFLTAIFLFAIRNIKRYPYFAVGWLWFLGTFIPAIGIVQVGMQAMADRYAYVPLIGVFIMIAWGVPDLMSRWHGRQIGCIAIAALLFPTLMAITWEQVGYWANSTILYEHALNSTKNNDIAHYNYGKVLDEQGRLVDAMKHYSEAVRIRPTYTEAHNNLGVALARQGKHMEAVKHYLKVLRIKPDDENVYNNLGIAYAQQDHLEEAIFYFKKALCINPDYADVHRNLGVALINRGSHKEAVLHFQNALRLQPSMAAMIKIVIRDLVKSKDYSHYKDLFQ